MQKNAPNMHKMQKYAAYPKKYAHVHYAKKICQTCSLCKSFSNMQNYANYAQGTLLSLLMDGRMIMYSVTEAWRLFVPVTSHVNRGCEYRDWSDSLAAAISISKVPGAYFAYWPGWHGLHNLKRILCIIVCIFFEYCLHKLHIQVGLAVYWLQSIPKLIQNLNLCEKWNGVVSYRPYTGIASACTAWGDVQNFEISGVPVSTPVLADSDKLPET